MLEYRGLLSVTKIMRVIGLTGGIGTGKSEVSRILQKLGALLINADCLGHATYRPKTDTWQRIVDTFGKGVVNEDGEINRKRLGEIVFSQPEAKAKLDSITWPEIAKLARRRIESLRSQETDTIVFEAAVLLEAGWDSLVDEVWITYSPRNAVIDRLKKRDHLPTEEINSRINAQIPLVETSKDGQILIENASTLEELNARVKFLLESLKKESTE